MSFKLPLTYKIQPIHNYTHTHPQPITNTPTHINSKGVKLEKRLRLPPHPGRRDKDQGS